MSTCTANAILGALIAAFSLCATASTLSETAPTASSNQAQAEIERLKLEQQRLLEEVRQEISRLPAEPTKGSVLTPKQKALLARRRDLVVLLDQVERRIAADPVERTRYIYRGVKEQPYKGYLERFQSRVAEAGTRDFPYQNGNGLYGELILSISIMSSGQIAGIEVHRSSSDALKDHALKLLKTLEPFEKFGSEMGRDVERVVLTVPFSYRKD